MSLGGQDIRNLILPEQPSNTPGGKGGAMSTSGERFGAAPGSKGGALSPEDEQVLRYYIASQPAVIEAFNNAGAITDPTALAQQAILARPMNPSFTGQRLLSREVPLGIQGNAGLAYPSMASTGLLNVPSYTSRYAGADSGGGGGSYGGATTAGGLNTYGSYNSLSDGLVGALMGNLSSPSYGITVDNMGTYADQPGFGYGSGMTGVGNPGESDFGGYTSSDSGIGNPGESGGYGGYGGTSSDTGTGNPGESDGGGYGGSDSGGYGGGDSGGSDSGGSDSGGGSDGGSDGGGWAKGGRVTKDRLKGRNPKGPDDGYGALEEGEYVIRKKAVQKYGDGLMSMINSGKFKG